MIVGLGHDLVHIPRMARLAERWGPRFLDRVFVPEEQVYCAARADAAAHWAVRFAAKEAFYKALSRGRALPLYFRDAWVSVAGDRLSLEISDAARTIAQSAGIAHTHVSLTHDGEYASAVVVLESQP